jgi:hypothetical protein
LVIGVGLWVIGVPSAPLWGVLAMILRFVPYLGAPIAAIFPLILAAAVDPGWTMVVLALGLFVIVEPLVGQAIEPLVYGQSTGLSPVAVIASATFWTWLWGPIGLILATPLTMCLVVVGRHVDRLKFLEVLFGDQPPLTPPELFYQRVLARDPVEAAEQAQMFLKEKPLAVYHDEILREGLRLAQEDAAHGLLDEERLQRIRDAVAEIVDDLSTHKDKNDKDKKEVPSEGTEDASEVPQSSLSPIDTAEGLQQRVVVRERWRNGTPVLCVPGMGLLDEAAAIVVAQLVEREGISARPEKADTLSMSRLFSWDTKDAALVCLCYVESVTSAQIRYAVRRVRRRAPEALILVALFGSNDMQIESEGLGGDIQFVRPSFRATVDKIVAAATAPSENESLAEPMTAAAV